MIRPRKLLRGAFPPAVSVCLLCLGLGLVPTGLFAVAIRIEKPGGGVSTRATQLIEGSITGTNLARALVIVNGIPQDVPVKGGRFSVNVVVSPGENIVEVKAAGASAKIAFFARVPPRDIKIVLAWDDARYVDLWVTDPSGERCYWAQPVTKNGGNLIANDETGFGPQIFTMQNAIPGQYSIQVQYYSKGDAPASRVKIYVVLYEGTAHESRRNFDFLMTKERTIYKITDFTIEASR